MYKGRIISPADRMRRKNRCNKSAEETDNPTMKNRPARKENVDLWNCFTRIDSKSTGRAKNSSDACKCYMP